MNQMVIFVLDNDELLEDVLQAWVNAGVKGATAVDSLGMAKVLHLIDESRPMFPSIGGIFQDEHYHYTIFSFIDDEVEVQALLTATEQVVGDLNKPNTGIFAVLPISFVKGIHPK
jgi:hypothetical protein